MSPKAGGAATCLVTVLARRLKPAGPQMGVARDGGDASQAGVWSLCGGRRSRHGRPRRAGRRECGMAAHAKGGGGSCTWQGGRGSPRLGLGWVVEKEPEPINPDSPVVHRKEDSHAGQNGADQSCRQHTRMTAAAAAERAPAGESLGSRRRRHLRRQRPRPRPPRPMVDRAPAGRVGR
eukprot:scaffold6824_cov118-Isochrysis_galbana.AAC.4